MKRTWIIVQLLYWRRYAKSLERQLEGERWRNQSREDELLTVPMRYLGMYGVATRVGRAQQVEPLSRIAERKRTVPQVSAWASLSDEERSEWAIYREDTDAAGVPEQQAKREFLQMLEMRHSANDAEIM